jgi:hypothetical protein
MKSTLRYSKASGSTKRLVERVIQRGWQPGDQPGWFLGSRKRQRRIAAGEHVERNN